MSVPLSDLVQELTIAQARASVYAALVSLGVPTTSWRPNAVVRVLVEVLAILLCGISVVIVQLTKMGFREYATGTFETARAKGFYGIDRLIATYGTGTITLTNAGGGVYVVDAGDLIVQLVSSGKTYTNSATFTLSGLTSLVVNVIALEAGTASNAGASVPMVLVTPLTGVTVTANTAIVGRDEETDDELKAREDASIDALSPNGPAGAYLAAASAAVRGDGTSIGVTRVAVSAPSSVGVVTATVASAAGAITGTVGTPGDDIDCVNRAIQGTDGGGCVPLGVTCTVQSASALAVPITYHLYVYTTDGRSTTEIEDAVEVLLDAWFALRPIGGDGGYVYAAAVRSVIMSVSSYAYNCTLTLPSGDTTVTATQIPTVGTITPTTSLVIP